MNLIIWLIAGGAVGWVASLLMRTEGEQGVLSNVLFGIVGGAIGGWLISPLLGVDTVDDRLLSMGSLAMSLLGAIALLGTVNLIQRGTAR